MRLDIRRIQTLKNGDEAVGNRTRVKVVKNKMAPPFKSAEFDMLYGEGISREGSVIDMAQQVGVVKKSGSWFTYEGDQLGQGREKVRQFLKDNPAITEEIENKVKAEFGLIGSADQFARKMAKPQQRPPSARLLRLTWPRTARPQRRLLPKRPVPRPAQLRPEHD